MPTQYIIKWKCPSMNTEGVSEEGLYSTQEEAMSTAKRLAKADSGSEYFVACLGEEIAVSKAENVRKFWINIFQSKLDGQLISSVHLGHDTALRNLHSMRIFGGQLTPVASAQEITLENL